MEISPFGLFLIFYYIYLLAAKSPVNRFMASIVMLLICSLTIQMGFFVMVGDKGIPYSTVATMATAFFGFLIPLSPQKKHYQKFNLICVLFLLSSFASVVLFEIFPYEKTIIANSDYSGFLEGKVGYSQLSTSNIKYGLIYISILLTYILIRIKACLSMDNIYTIIHRFITVSVIMVIGVGVIEFIFENFFHSLFVTNATISVFGEYGAQQNSLFDRNGLFAIQGTTKEASIYSVSLLYTAMMTVCLTALPMVTKRKKRLYNLSLFAIIVLLIINRAMSSYVYVLILMMSVMFVNPYKLSLFKNPVIVSRLVTIIVLIILLTVVSSDILLSFVDSDNYFLNRLALSINEFMGMSNGAFTNSSEGIRFLGISQCWKVFIERPLFGVGYTELVCLSGLVTMLVSIGLIGTYLWCKINLSFSDVTIRKGWIILVIVIVLPNLLLNDVETMLSIFIPLTCLLFSSQTKNNSIR